MELWDEGSFAKMDKSELALLIRKQLKPFRKRPLIKDEEALIKDLPGILDAMRASDDDFVSVAVFHAPVSSL